MIFISFRRTRFGEFRGSLGRIICALLLALTKNTNSIILFAAMTWIETIALEES
jgi:hypothetical protein